jgi:hypothetical protein
VAPWKKPPKKHSREEETTATCLGNCMQEHKASASNAITIFKQNCTSKGFLQRPSDGLCSLLFHHGGVFRVDLKYLKLM